MDPVPAQEYPTSPDGWFYLRAGAGHHVPHPYRLRWLLPRLLGAVPRRWALLTYASLAAMPPAAWFYFSGRGLSGAGLAIATALLCALPGHRLSLRFPVLLDAPSFTGALLVAGLAERGLLLPAVVAALLLGATRESAPIFAALWAWHPAPLLGLLAVGWWRPRAAPGEAWLQHPVREALLLRRRIGPDASLYLRPWGAALLGLTVPTGQNLATLLLAHAQLLMAQDCCRLVIWAAPVLCANAASVIPSAWGGIAVLVTAMHREDRA